MTWLFLGPGSFKTLRNTVLNLDESDDALNQVLVQLLGEKLVTFDGVLYRRTDR